MLHPVIMAGGSGTRFWPRSRHRRPKQLIEVVGPGTLIQQTVARLTPPLPRENLLIITHAVHTEAVRAQLPDLAENQVIAEPVGRDTAAAIGLAALLVRRSEPDGVMAVLCADQVIQPAEALIHALETAAAVAAQRRVLVTFGIRPSFPSTRYGYIRRGAPLAEGCPARRVAEFREKPSRAVAEEYMRSGEFYWNSGNFVWRADDILEAIRQFMPELHDGLERIAPALGTPDQEAALTREYPALPRRSIDYGVMEKAANAAVIEAGFAWDDVGGWDALRRHYPPDADGNTLLAEHAALDTRNCIVLAEKGHLVATLGVTDLVIVQTPDATLVCHRERAEDVKRLVESLKDRGLERYL